MQFADCNEAEVVFADPQTEVVEILWMNDREVHLLLPDGEEAVWPIGSLVGQLQGVERLRIQVMDGDVDIVPLPIEAITA
ncbi:hypothetical protein [Deinococcus sp. SL84]|uniref:hypothetical protein n=1 Tax=Deinococcus sp. SL84 TaxID=2994663 RepID=UPI00227339C6|nr:hypothetical protein [Deinococcus sp. SL84]MCY1704331.1 hypothetical protein [Deinococcus sp. SL84]